jgi:transcriptional regulator GlxA family with amidase domain
MASFSAKPRRIVLLAFEGALALDIAGPSDAFGIANRLEHDRPPYYSLRYVSVRGGPVRASSGLTL